MCDCVSSTPLALSLIKNRKLGFTTSNWRPLIQSISRIHPQNCPKPSILRVSRNSDVLGSEEYEFYREAGFKDKGKGRIELETSRGNGRLDSDSTMRNGVGTGNGTAEVSSNLLELKDGLESGNRNGKSKGSLAIEGVDSDNVDLKMEETGRFDGSTAVRRGKQVMRRSSMLAKQVISIQTALSLGFVSQLWVDTVSWMVVFVEVRPNLLSGESERFLLEDVRQVGDVLLVEDESVMENEFKMVGLETLVGYKVVTPGQRNIGKVRGYTFNINSGAVELLELDSFGMSLIPSSLVSTYALFVEDVMEVVSDTVVVHEAAASRIQRLTKGFWDAQNTGTSIDDLEDYSNFERPVQSRRRRFNSRKFNSKMSRTEDDWDLPMDYL